MITGSSIAQLDYYKNALLSQIQSARIWCFFNTEADNWPEKKQQLDSLEYDLNLVKDRLRVVNNEMFKQQIEKR